MACCLLLGSCDYSYNYTYIIRNDADTAIALHMKRSDYPDTTLLIPAQATDTLFITGHGLEHSHGPYFHPVFNDLSTAAISKKGVLSQRNYLSDIVWTFAEGFYTATVQNGEF